MENVQPHIAKQVGKEIQDILTSALEGIHLVVNDQDVTDVQAMIDGPPGTPYAEGQFRVKLHLTSAYPREPPKGFFLTKIFHPNIAPSNGEICVNTMKKDWTADLGIKHLLLTIKCLLIVPNPESALNEQAGRLLLEDYTEYARRARLFTDVHARRMQHKGGGGGGGWRTTGCSSSSTTGSHEGCTGGDLPSTSQQQGVLRDTNSSDTIGCQLHPKKHSIDKDPSSKKTVSAAKKALKRL